MEHTPQLESNNQHKFGTYELRDVQSGSEAQIEIKEGKTTLKRSGEVLRVTDDVRRDLETFFEKTGIRSVPLRKARVTTDHDKVTGITFELPSQEAA